MLPGGRIDYAALAEGTLPLPESGQIPLLRWDAVRAEQRKVAESSRALAGERLVSLADAPVATCLAAADLTARMFAAHEPMHRHFRPGSVPTPGLELLPAVAGGGAREPCVFSGAPYVDAFGAATEYGDFSSNATHFYWYVRSFVVQDATRADGPARNETALRLSCAFVVPKVAAGAQDEANKQQEQELDVTFAVFNDRMPPLDAAPAALRLSDPAVRAAGAYIRPPLSLVEDQDAALVPALCAFSPEFARDAATATEASKSRSGAAAAEQAANLIVHVQLVSKSEAMTTDEAFSRLCCVIAWLADAHRCKYLIVEASNMRTATFLDALGFLPVHYARFQSKQRAVKSDTRVPEGPSSTNGFVSDRDTGMIAMAVKLRET